MAGLTGFSKPKTKSSDFFEPATITRPYRKMKTVSVSQRVKSPPLSLTELPGVLLNIEVPIQARSVGYSKPLGINK